MQSVFAALFIAVQLLSKLICSVHCPHQSEPHISEQHTQSNARCGQEIFLLHSHCIALVCKMRILRLHFSMHFDFFLPKARLLSTRPLTLSEQYLHWLFFSQPLKLPWKMLGRLYDIFLFCCFYIFLCRRFMTFSVLELYEDYSV